MLSSSYVALFSNLISGLVNHHIFLVIQVNDLPFPSLTDNYTTVQCDDQM